MEHDQVFDLVITGGNVVFEEGILEASIGIKEGKIKAIVDPEVDLSSQETIYCEGKTIFPGLIDPHVHLWEPGFFEYREGFKEGSAAAAAGGVTTLIEMPLSVPPVVDEESFNLKYAIASDHSVVDFALWGGLIPSSIDDLEELHRLGVVGHKAFMSYASKSYPHAPDFELWKAMTKISEFNGLVGVHAENADITFKMSKEYKEANLTDPLHHADARPEVAELESVQKAILFAEKTGCRLYVVHMSLPEGIEMVNQAKRRKNVQVYSETCHHYLLFDQSYLSKHGAFIKCNPPLRSKEAVEGLWNNIREEEIDCIGSDHGPYTDEEKTKGHSNFWDAPSGFGGIELILPVMISEGYHKRNIKLETIAKLTSTNAAKIFGLYPKKGTIRIGSDADLTIVDLNHEWVYDATNSLSKVKSEFSPYHKRKFRGKVMKTIVRGSVVYSNHSIEVKPGYGKFVSYNQ
ncbi:allantoinase AllB [Alkalihalobacillus oceani]|uniref:allantoinase AllB n=1 Tax=Halalkalibacter oceani TaxID=1653776 RepID=UPI0020413F2A|nr:allantoinase AllB [Halalkalibacter oceani]MCM3760441.1 allantoinase AllB [Halalkalibacter oceani]